MRKIKRQKYPKLGKNQKKIWASMEMILLIIYIKYNLKNQSINSSMRGLSRGEEFVQKDILQVLNGGNNNVSKIII